MNYFPILCGNLSVPFLSPPPHPTSSLPHWPPDGRGTDPSLLVRSVTSVAHLGVARGASGRVHASPPCQGSRACQLLHLQRAAAADATHLQVNVFWEELCQSAGEWSKPAIQLEQNRLRGFLHCKVRQRRQPLVGKRAVVSRVRLAYCDNLVIVFCGCPSLAGILRNGGHSSGCRISWQCGQWVLCTKITMRPMNTYTHAVIYRLHFGALVNCWPHKCVIV